MHLPRFETISALKHHCGICKTPFSNPNSLSTCIGKHEVICSQYHFMFHFVGKAHTCKACSNGAAQQQKRHRAVLLLFQDYRLENGGNDGFHDLLISPTSESPHSEKLRKTDKKAQKKVGSKPPLKLDIVKQSDLAALEKLIYCADAITEDADQALADALAMKFNTSVFSEKRMLDTLMAPPRDKPDLQVEAERVLSALAITKPENKAARNLLEKIRSAIMEDIDVQWNTELQMKRRRIVYAQWVTQGAVANMAVHYEDWDINTGARTNRRYKGDERGSKDQYNTAIYEDDFDRLDDPDDATSTITNLTRSHSLADDEEITTPGSYQAPQTNTKNAPLNDTRRGGNALTYVNKLPSPYTWDEENCVMTPTKTTPSLRITTQPIPDSKTATWATAVKVPALDLSVQPPGAEHTPRTKRAHTSPYLSSPSPMFKSPRTNAWASSSPAVGSPTVESAPLSVEDMIEATPPLRMAASVKVIAKPVVVDGPLDDGWTAVSKKGKATHKLGKKMK